MALSAEPDLKVSSEDGKDPYAGDTAKSGPSGPVKMLALLVGATIVIGGIAVAFGPRIMSMVAEGGGEVPVINAENAPIKVRPENPGGMQVPNQDRLVYGVVDGTASEPRVERLLPPAERPVDVDQVLTRSVPEVSDVVTENAPRGVDDTLAPGAPRSLVASPTPDSTTDILPPPITSALPDPAPSPPPAPAAPTASTAAPSTTPSEVAAVPSAPVAAEVPTPAPVPTAPAASTSAQSAPAATTVARATPAPAAPRSDISQSFRVQLAAARSEAAVRSEWDRLRGRNVDLLGDLSLQITRIDLGATRGVFYRMRVGPLASETSAKTLCERLKQRKLGCLVVKPGS
jgi:cell division septation protein DedD